MQTTLLTTSRVMSNIMGLVDFISILSPVKCSFFGNIFEEIQISEKNFKELSLCNNLTPQPCAVLKFLVHC